jgi:hypothetical protein
MPPPSGVGDAPPPIEPVPPHEQLAPSKATTPTGASRPVGSDQKTDPWGWTKDSSGHPLPPGAAPSSEASAVGSQGRTRRHAKGSRWSGRRLALVGSSAAVILAGIGIGGYVLASNGKASSPPPRAKSHTPIKKKKTSTVKVVAIHPQGPTCPLTGLPAPGGKVPQRPVLAVKVGNDPDARPQSGLEDADIVFDTLAEGGITRYIAVYQCGNASDVGPVRSVRWDDWHILQMFGRADLAFVHGIDPDVATVESLPWVCDLDAFAHYSLYTTDPNREAPEATYTSTAALWSGCPAGPAPPAIFQFSATPPATATRMTSAELNYSYDADVVWVWSPTHHAFLHFYRENGSLVPDMDDLGQQLQATNVVIEMVTLEYGPYEETPGSTGDVESQTAGSGGVAYVLRDGVIEKGTWSRPTWSDIATLTLADGKTMTLQPGQTWVEYVPDTDAVTLTAPAPAPPATTTTAAPAAGA